VEHNWGNNALIDGLISSKKHYEQWNLEEIGEAGLKVLAMYHSP
jgi:hypothetical protein